jgi:hypothetical protein
VATSSTAQAPIRSTIPARLDRLGWSAFHTRMVAGLGAAWILVGPQITIASSVTGVLTQPTTFDMTSTGSEAIAVFFAIGCIAGAIGPAFYGALIGDGSSRTGLFIGYLVGAGIMIGINAEGKSLEAVTKPLTAAAAA